MASVYFGLNRGQTEFQIATSASTNSTDVEVRIDQTKNLTRQEIIQEIEMIKHAILKDKTNFGL